MSCLSILPAPRVGETVRFQLLLIGLFSAFKVAVLLSGSLPQGRASGCGQASAAVYQALLVSQQAPLVRSPSRPVARRCMATAYKPKRGLSSLLHTAIQDTRNDQVCTCVVLYWLAVHAAKHATLNICRQEMQQRSALQGTTLTMRPSRTG